MKYNVSERTSKTVEICTKLGGRYASIKNLNLTIKDRKYDSHEFGFVGRRLKVCVFWNQY